MQVISHVWDKSLFYSILFYSVLVYVNADADIYTWRIKMQQKRQHSAQIPITQAAGAFPPLKAIYRNL